MARVQEVKVLQLRNPSGAETLHVFRVWQGGASQGEQLMLVSLSDSGVGVIGPLQDEFDDMEIVPANTEEGPLFMLYGAGDGPLAVYEYFNGQMIEPLAADSACRRIKKPR